MANGIASITIVGNVGREPEQSGKGPAKFSVAVGKSKKVGDEWKTNTTWFNVSCWANTAESVLKNIQKGDQVMVQGSIESREYNDKTYWEVTAFIVQRLNKRDNATVVEDGLDKLIDDTDLPF